MSLSPFTTWSVSVQSHVPASLMSPLTLFKPPRGKRNSPSLHSSLSLPAEGWSLTVCLSVLENIPAESHVNTVLFHYTTSERDTQLQQSTGAGPRDVLRAEHGELQILLIFFVILLCTCSNLCFSIKAWCVVVHDGGMFKTFCRLDRPALIHLEDLLVD